MADAFGGEIRLADDLTVADPYAPSLRRQQARQHLAQLFLAIARDPRDAQNFAATKIEADVFERLAAERVADADGSPIEARARLRPLRC